MATNQYQQRQDDKRARLAERADALQTEGEERVQQSFDFFRQLNGQPMLPGHHSYKSDRNRREKHDRNIGRGFDMQDQAAELNRRAGAVGSAGVASDDPEAVRKLREKLDYVNGQRDEVKAVNKLVRKHGPPKRIVPEEGWDFVPLLEALAAEGLSRWESEATTPEWGSRGRVGVPSYVLTNLTAKAKDTEKRIAALEAMAEAPTVDREGEGWAMWQDDDEGRIFLRLDGRLTSESFRTLRSRGGFNWSRRNEQFVRKITPNSINTLARLDIDAAIEWEG